MTCPPQHTLKRPHAFLIDHSSHIPVDTYKHCKKCGVTERLRGAIFSCFRGNSMGYHGNMKILLPLGVPIHHIFFIVRIIKSGLELTHMNFVLIGPLSFASLVSMS